MRPVLRALVILLSVLVIVFGAVFFYVRGRGFSARSEPGRLEESLARYARRLAIPAAARDRENPVPRSAEAIHDGLEHFADHCAICHGNDGGGETVIGQGLYPKAPDMRLPATQELTDGELFYVIENGIPLTGMPAWGTGTPESEEASWRLVHFMRHQPDLSAEEIAEMEALNPKSPDEWRQQMEIEEFLRGGEAPAGPSQPSHRHEGGKDDK
jgi:mono/diheme cytochrome c family protein